MTPSVEFGVQPIALALLWGLIPEPATSEQTAMNNTNRINFLCIRYLALF